MFCFYSVFGGERIIRVNHVELHLRKDVFMFNKMTKNTNLCILSLHFKNKEDEKKTEKKKKNIYIFCMKRKIKRKKR